MTFTESLSYAMDRLFSTAGVTADYTPKNGVPIEGITVLRNQGAGDEQQGADDLGMSDVVKIKKSDVTLVAPGDVIVYEADPLTEWEVSYGNIKSQGLLWVVQISKR